MTTTERLDLTPGSEAWLTRISASKVAAILGVSPYESPYSIWRLMRHDITPAPSNLQQRRGNYLEPGILHWWRDQHNVGDNYTNQPQFTLTDPKLGDWAVATPDLVAILDGEHVLVEGKSAAKPEEWGQPGSDSIPAYYLCQVFWQMHVSGIHRCHVPVLNAYLRFENYIVDYDPTIGADLEARMRTFLASLTQDTPPPIDGRVPTWNAVRRLHPDIDTGEVVEVSDVVADQLVRARHEIGIWTEVEISARSVICEAMGRAQYAEAGGRRVARRQPNKTGVSFVTVAKGPSFIPQEEDQTND